MHFGLSEKEAKIYIAALKLGASPVQKIAQEADVNRATAYANIDKLMKEGLMSSFKEGKKFYFYAERPEKILHQLIKKQKIELENRSTSLVRVLPELKAHERRQSDAPALSYYKGSEGIKEVCKTILQGHEDTYRIIYNHELFYENFKPRELQDLAHERLRKNIFAKVIRITKDKSAESRHTEHYNVSPEELDISLEMSIFDKTSLIVSLKDPLSGISINNENITNTFKEIFDLLWDIMEKRAKEKETHYQHKPA